MRTFVAIPLPESIRDALYAHGKKLSSELPPARWVSADRMHLTLVFLGEVTEESTEGICTAAAAAGGRHPTLTLQLESAGTFPTGRPARVAWIGLRAPQELLALQRDLRAALSRELGEALDSRSYRPHLTMARCRRPWPRAASELWSRSAPPALDCPFTVTYFDLMHSRLTPSGPHYSILKRVSLEG